MNRWSSFLASRTLHRTLVFLALAAAARLGASYLESSAQGQSFALLEGIAILATGLALIRLAALAVFRAALPAMGVEAPRIAEEVALLAAYLIWTMLRLRLAGMDLASLVTTSAVVTAVVAFAMQDTLGNVLSGLFLELDRSIAVGDWVKLDDVSGRVFEISWRHTTIRTRNAERVKVPNASLMKSRFTVIGNPDKQPVRWRRWIWFNVDLEVPPGRVIAAAEQAVLAADIPNVAREPAPSCVLMEFGPGHCRYALRFWICDPQPDDGTDSAVRVHLLTALQRAGIALALPQSLQHEVGDSEARRARQRAGEIETRATALRRVEIFAMLTEAERHSVAERLLRAPFAAGDVVTRQAAVAHWLYILTGGEVDVWLEAEGSRRWLAKLGPGSVFGEMGMMTGEPRRATVTAHSDIECYRLDKEAFAGILHARPEIAEGISKILAARDAELHQAADAAHAEAAAARNHSEGLLKRIRSFFGLEAGNGSTGRERVQAATA